MNYRPNRSESGGDRPPPSVPLPLHWHSRESSSLVRWEERQKREMCRRGTRDSEAREEVGEKECDTLQQAGGAATTTEAECEGRVVEVE